MVKTFQQNGQQNLTDDPERKTRLSGEDQKREELIRKGKPNEMKNVMAVRRNPVVNGPEWVQQYQQILILLKVMIVWN